VPDDDRPTSPCRGVPPKCYPGPTSIRWPDIGPPFHGLDILHIDRQLSGRPRQLPRPARNGSHRITANAGGVPLRYSNERRYRAAERAGQQHTKLGLHSGLEVPGFAGSHQGRQLMQATMATLRPDEAWSAFCGAHLTKRLTERIWRSARTPSGAYTQPPCFRYPDHDLPPSPALDQTPDRRAGPRDPRSFLTRQRLHMYLKTHRYTEFRDELARAELAGEISEFYALSFQAVLAMAEGSELAAEYLEMAEAVASSPYEQAVIAEDRAAYDLLHDNPSAAAERCLATLDRIHQTEGLWVHLLIALHRLGEVETIDAALRRLTTLDGEGTTRIVGRLSTDPGLRDVRARPAFQQLLGKHAAGGR
jgi:hypothetical protein